MGCINWRTFGAAVMLSCLLAVAGCASNEKKKNQPAPPEPAAEMATGASLVAIPNPYLAQDVKTPPAAQTAFRNALVAMQSEDWSVAEKQLRDLHQKYPELSGPLVNLGIVQWRQNKLDEADKMFAQALTVNPINNDAYVQYGFFLRDQGRFADAEKVYLKALKVWPHNAAAHRNLGILYDLYMGKFEAALKHYEMVLRLSSEPNKEVEGWIIDLKRRLASG